MLAKMRIVIVCLLAAFLFHSYTSECKAEGNAKFMIEQCSSGVAPYELFCLGYVIGFVSAYEMTSVVAVMEDGKLKTVPREDKIICSQGSLEPKNVVSKMIELFEMKPDTESVDTLILASLLELYPCE